MAAARIFLCALGLIGLARGQSIFHLRDDGVYNSLNPLLFRDFRGNRVTMCYNGIDVFVAEGNALSVQSAVLRIPADATDPTTAPNVYQIIDVQTRDIAIDCCCQYVVYSFPDVTSGQYKIHFRSLEQESIFKEFVINDPVRIASLNLFCERETIRVTTQFAVYEFDIANAGAPPFIYQLNGLVASPRCSTSWNNGSIEYLITAYEDRDQIEVTPLNGDLFSRERIFRNTGSAMKTACVTTVGNDLFSFSRLTDESMGYIITIPVMDVISTADEGIFVDIGLAVTQPLVFVVVTMGDFVNGISLCVDCASLPCIVESSSTCVACDEPGFGMCGFCSSDRKVCVCSQSLETGCNFTPEMEDMCFRPTERMDAFCVVNNPLADRRGGGPVEVAVAIGTADQPLFQSSDIVRAARTGRWRIKLPESVPIANGFSAPVPDFARGRRFGLYATNIARTDGITESLYCLATEKSAFFNKVLTYATYEGGTVTMEVTMTNSEFVNEVRWRRTNLNTGRISQLPNSGALSLTIAGASKGTDEGMYQVYRQTRQLRTWHPFMYLYVRACVLDRYGTDCSLQCPICGNGICDVVTGTCRCHPGFTGENCMTACPTPNLIGQNCDIDCSQLFDLAGNECRNLEICGAEDMGCGCRSGLKPPDCTTDCDAGKWGPSCSETCTCTAGEICDPRVGCI